ncbi:uncharacterized protein PRCAT00000040001 [Priceomyces carsonii]|uniref:uncharacterized protein n=1 Tax=Priceomyces carsonii TaxID=28549 RepID=UPI002ED7E220|nr:unnamed protein product [Priceomyces carsonii]
MSSDRERKKLSTRLNALFEGIYELTDGSGQKISETFQRLPLRTGTDYYKIVLNPVSLHGIGRTIKKSGFDNAQDFINQLAQITWNARLYNVKGSKIYNEALILDHYITDKVIPKLQNDKAIVNHQYLYYPDLGPLPEEDRPIQENGFEEEEEEEDDYDDYSSRTTNPAPTDHHYKALMANNLLTNRLRDNSTSPFQAKQHLETGIRRGRPPIIDKPFETRIKLILKQMKKLRDPNNPSHPLTTHFDRLPDQRVLPNYYHVVANPISLNEIRAKVRTRKYSNVNLFLADLSLMFQNTKLYYSNDQYSEVLRDCLTFESETNHIIEQELKRSEKDLLVSNTSGNDGIIRIPLDSIEVNGYSYRIGDWVLINNANEPSKPTVGQIFRLWSTEDGTKYTNVCWYYRPEQTCHKFDRLFFINEVCKTGQYRDHLASEIVGPCYVIFLTRYQKGDLPEGVIAEGCPWFICEFRYNENSHIFNRIRTWKACLPDEIRDKSEQPLVPLSEPRKLIKYESPIKDLLPAGADINMPIPEPTPGPNANSPPIVGLVYLRPPSEEDELGQYISSPNVTASPENDDRVNNRRAFLFTPVLQLKFGGGLNMSYSIMNSSNPDIEDKSYNSSVTRYRQLLQQQQQQVQHYQQSRQHTPSVKRAHTPTSGGAIMSQTGASYHTSTSAYSTLINGGVLSYTLADEDNKLSEISDGFNLRKRRLEDSEEINELVWYRAPPLLVNNRVVSDGSIILGHSAQYVAWKLKNLST